MMTVMRNLRLADALDHGGSLLPKVRTRFNGQRVVQVFPQSAQDRVLLTGYSAEVWVEPGQEPTQGQIYQVKAAGEVGEGGVALVLGAGNQASIGPMDVLHKLIAEDEVCLLKMNPVNDLGAHLLRALRPWSSATSWRFMEALRLAIICATTTRSTSSPARSGRMMPSCGGPGAGGAAQSSRATQPQADHQRTRRRQPDPCGPGDWTEQELAFQAAGRADGRSKCQPTTPRWCIELESSTASSSC